MRDLGRLFFDMAMKDENIGYYVDVYNASIFRLDLDTMQSELVVVLPVEYHDVCGYINIAVFQDKLVLAPRWGKSDILIYDIKDGGLNALPIEGKYIPNHKNYNLFYKIELYGQNAFIFPGRYQAVVKLDLNDFSVSYITDCFKGIENSYDTDSVFINQILRVDSRICLLPLNQHNIILEFHLDTLTFQNHILHRLKGRRCFGISLLDNQFIVSVHDSGQLYIWNWNGFEDEYCEIPLTDYPQDGVRNIISSDQYLYVFPAFQKRLYQISKKNRQIVNCFDFNESSKKEDIYPGTFLAFHVVLRKGRELIYVRSEENIYLLNLETGDLIKREIIITENSVEQFKRWKWTFVWTNFLNENSVFGLKKLLLWMYDTHLDSQQDGRKLICGEKIYQAK